MRIVLRRGEQVGYSLIENPNTRVEYHEVLDTIIAIVNKEHFSGELWGNALTGFLDVKVRRIKKPYCVSVKEDDSGVISTLTINRRIFEDYDNDLGDRSYGVVNLILRGLCEHFAKSLMRVTRLEEESRKEVLIMQETAEVFLHRAWSLAKSKRPGMKRETQYQYRQRMTTRGWRPIFFTAMLDVCGHCPAIVLLPRKNKQDKILSMYPYIVHHDSLVVKREARPVRKRRTRLKPTGKQGVTVYLKTGNIRTEGIAS